LRKLQAEVFCLLQDPSTFSPLEGPLFQCQASQNFLSISCISVPTPQESKHIVWLGLGVIILYLYPPTHPLCPHSCWALKHSCSQPLPTLLHLLEAKVRSSWLKNHISFL
jgi:hypothetical protein